MGYVALKPLKVQLAGERKITLVQPGEALPGAEAWTKVKQLVAKGVVAFVADEKVSVEEQGEAKKFKAHKKY